MFSPWQERRELNNFIDKKIVSDWNMLSLVAMFIPLRLVTSQMDFRGHGAPFHLSTKYWHITTCMNTYMYTT